MSMRHFFSFFSRITMNIVIIKYNAGNVFSVSNALERLGINAIVSSDLEVIQQADKIIFPGVGEASTAMRFLRANGLDLLIPKLKQPFFGICLGLQLMCKHSEENNTDCLGIFDENVKLFPPTSKVPQMGWNLLDATESSLFEDLPNPAYVYYVHSYYAEVGEHTVATTSYSTTFSAALNRDNFYALQAHPEKSGAVGSKILENFIKL
jgi:glutamine amidotransferase